MELIFQSRSIYNRIIQLGKIELHTPRMLLGKYFQKHLEIILSDILVIRSTVLCKRTIKFGMQTRLIADNT